MATAQSSDSRTTVLNAVLSSAFHCSLAALTSRCQTISRSSRSIATPRTQIGDEVAVLIDGQGGLGVQHGRGLALLHDERTLEAVAWTQAVPVDHFGLDPAVARAPVD